MMPRTHERERRLAVAGLLLLLCTSLTGRAAAAPPVTPGTVEEAIQRLVADTHGRVRRSPDSRLLRFFAAPPAPTIGIAAIPSASAETNARAFLRAYGAAFGLATQPETTLLRPPHRDALGFDHVRFRQLHRGLAVAGAELMVHLRGSAVAAANGRTVDDAGLAGVSVTPRQTAEQAHAAAQSLLAERGVVAPELSEPSLEILSRGLFGGTGPARLTWFVVARAPRLHELMWVDAETGEVLLHFNQMPEDRQRLVYDAGNGTTLPGQLVRSEGQDPTGDLDADAAYQYAGDTYDYFRTRFGRDGIDGMGQPLVLSVHYGVDYQNAFWDTSLEQIAFGDLAARADDVVGHEITHGLTQHTANLYYYRQSGALNEAVSDIFGETVDLLNGAGNDSPAVRWLASEDWPGVGPIRNMMDPNAMGSPGRVGDTLVQCGEFDNGGVHTNSGILNHAYALTVDGGSYNGRTISGIGLEKAGAVVYRALTTYLTATADYQDADAALRQSCLDLEAGGQVAAAECQQLGLALDAVEAPQPWPCVEPSVVVTKRGNAAGMVTSYPPGINCGDVCESPFPAGAYVQLDASPDAGAVFAGWGGVCSGVTTCQIQGLQGRVEVSAGFDLAGTAYPVSVSTSGNGTVRSSPAGIDCGGVCSGGFPSGSVVTLTATAPPGWALQAWGGDCTGRSACALTMDRPKTVTAAFAEAPLALAASLTAVYRGQAAWGDYDNDGDLDLVVVGSDSSQSRTTLYRNDGGTLVDSGIPLVQVVDFAAWGDYDNDGDLDLLLGGWTNAAPWYAVQLYRNDGGQLAPVPTPFPALEMGPSAAWGDFDNDGDLDLVISGYASGGAVTKLYRNDHGTFVDTATPLAGAYYARLAWVDYDGDGDLDLTVSGTGQPVRLYRNDNGVLVDSGIVLPRADSGSVAWADYNGDGYPDLAITGSGPEGVFTRLYRNDAGVLTDSGLAFPGVYYGSATWVDYDGDGDPDLLVTGMTTDGSQNYWNISRLFRNDGGTFVEVFAGLPELMSSAVAWGDYDGDGRMDLLLEGSASDGNHTGVYRNLTAASNTLPSAPTDGSATPVGSDAIRLAWGVGSDTETPAPALTYNLRVGTTPLGGEIVSPMADAATGYRRLVAPGNAGQTTAMTLRGLAPGTYYWAVQTVDASLAGSPFGATSSFTIGAGSASLAVATAGDGSGMIRSDPPGLDCASNCQAAFPIGSTVNLTATATPGSAFAGWSGDCAGTSSCVLTMDANRAVTGTFVRVRHELTVAATGNGTVASTPAGINCGTDCEEDFPSGTLVTLTATPAEGTIFAGWTGACTGVGTCVVSMDGPLSVGASFSTPQFVPVASLAPVQNGTAEWGDYDGDGRLDLAVVGMAPDLASSLTRLYHNSAGQLTDSGIGLLNVDSLVRWGDFDNDGDLDLLVGGWSAAPTKGSFLRLYRNDGGGLVAVDAGLATNIYPTDAAWGDFDNDGDLDLAVAGTIDNAWTTRLYRNDHGTFVDSGAISGPGKSVAWGDFDNDGDLDLLVAGDYQATRIYRNDSGHFVDIGAPLIAVDSGAAAWVDVDGDGLLDVVVAGLPAGGQSTTKLYHNDGTTFVEVATPLPGGIRLPSWGDYDGDGDLDALACGSYGVHLYRNDGGRLTEVQAGLPNLSVPGCAFGDYDGDGRQDAFMVGWGSSGWTGAVYRNTSAPVNFVPTVPASTNATVQADGVELAWDAASDAETPAPTLSYNVRVGTTPTGGEIVSAMADPASGRRLVVAPGNAGRRTSLRLQGLSSGQYYWAVQSVDTSFAGSAFANGGSFWVGPVAVSVAVGGAGSGSVASTPGGIDCGGTCQATFPLNSTVTLNATPASDSRFAGWTGACTGTGPCVLTLNGPPQAVGATFDLLPALSIGDVTVTEGDSGTKTAAFAVVLSAASASTVTVNYATWDDTAVAGSDYVSTSGTLTFAPGTTVQPVNVTIIGDTAVEPDETFSVTLSKPSGATMADRQGIGTIVNDDVLPPVTTEPVVWTRLVQANATGSALSKTGAAGWDSSGAVSTRGIGSGDGYVEFTPASASAVFMAGLATGDSSASRSDVEYAFSLDQRAALYVYESGVNRAKVGTYQAGARLRVAIENGKVVYRVNGKLVYTSAAPPPTQYPYVLDTALNSKGGAILSSWVSGSLVAVWPAATPVQWTHLVRASANGSALSKTGATGWDNAGAVSTTGIGSGDGWVAFTPASTSATFMAGLGAGDADASRADVEYAFYLGPSANLYVYESGVNRASVGKYQAGALLRVAVENGQVHYSVNGKLVYTSAVAPSQYPYVLDTALYSKGGAISSSSLAGALVPVN